MSDAEERLIHDLRNAAGVVRSAASQLHSDAEDLPSDMRAQLTEMLARRSEMLVRLLTDLATVRQVERNDLRVQMQRVDLADVCSFAVAEVVTPAQKTIAVEVPADLAVLADPVRLTQVIDNLVSNAIRYGGPTIRVTAAADGRQVRLSVLDDGPGVPPDLEESLFDSYARGPESDRLGGTGLGLSIVRELCTAMGGSVSYDGEAGTRFTVSLQGADLRSYVAPEPAPDREISEVEFWEHDAALVERVSTYVQEGLRAEEAVVLITRPEHLQDLQDRLQDDGIDLRAYVDSRQVLLFDAVEMHELLRDGNRIDTARFGHLLGTPIAEVHDRWGRVRVFGETVDVYWSRGLSELALQMESAWNNFRRQEGFTLLLGYRLRPEALAQARSHHR